MGSFSSKITILFEDPFWIGLCECENGDSYEVSKITFGPEPKDYEVYEFILNNWYGLRFSPNIQIKKTSERRLNPKRLQKIAKKQTLENAGIGTKAQQALKLQHEEGKLARKIRSKQQLELEKQKQFELRQKKRKEKHRGH